MIHKSNEPRLERVIPHGFCFMISYHRAHAQETTGVLLKEMRPLTGSEEEILKLKIISFQVPCGFNRKDFGQQARYIGDADGSKVILRFIQSCSY